MTRKINRLITLLLAGTSLTSPTSLCAVELPSGGRVAYGTVGIGQPSANQLAIQQSSQTAIVNWQGFSIGQGGRVDISQPSSSAALLNRVTGSTPSTIAGQLNANGQVYLINPNGIAITPTGIVKAGAFVASSLDIADEDFKAGRRAFRGSGNSATVSNAGTIDVARGGYAALLGGQVENSGTISVPLGRVGLGAGEQATLDFSGDGFLQVAVRSGADGSTAALIRHSGRIDAPGGRVMIQAAAARDAARNAINLSGIVEARSISGRSGAIVLGGGEGGSVAVSGRLDASARQTATSRAVRPARGGAITVTGHAIALSGATVTADGTAGGGSIRIGGDYQGGGTLQRAATTRVDAATRISANAGTVGDGGSIVVWSDRTTDFAGRISARGGVSGGNGGDAEVSGKTLLAYSGTADLGAARGLVGTLLLDPYNVVISDGPNSNQTGFAATGNDSVINAATLSAALGTANVTVTTGGAGSPGTQAGDITVLSSVAWNAPTTLTLQAYRSIVVNADLSVNGPGGLVLTTNNGGTGGSLSFGNGARATYATTNGAGIPGQSLTIDGQPYQLLYAVTDLQNMAGNLAGNYGLARSIDAGGTAFTPVGSTAGAFTGRFNGLGQTIANLTVAAPARDSSGLFGAATGATIANVNLAALNLTGGDNTGGLVGFATTTAVSGVTVAGRVAGGNTTGGLLGAQVGGSVANASSAATVTGTDNTGGLVGVMDGGVIARSFTTGQVSGGSQVGGLVGIAQSAGISQSYATGGVTGTDLVGGLVGGLGGEGTSQATGTVTSSYANGAVTSQGRGGGLVGLISNGGLIQDAYATGLTNGGAASGGLVGEVNSVPSEGGGSTANATVTTSYATGLVTGAGSRGGLIGNIVGVLQTITTSYWDTQTTGIATSAGTGATGLTTAQLQGALPAGFVPGTWGTQANAYPFLSWRFPAGVLAVSGFTRGAADPGTLLVGEAVRVATGGTASYQTNSGANGYYYVARDPLTGTAPQGASAYLDGANRGASITDAPIGAGAIINLDPRVGRVLVTTAQPTASALATELANAGDSALSANIPYTVAATGGVPTFGSGLPTTIAAVGGGFTVDRSILSAGGIQIAGAVTPAGQAPAGPLAIGAGQSVRSLNGDVILATSQFLNNAGAAAVQAGGRFLIYSQDYAADQRGGLAGGNLYNRSFAGNPPSTVAQAGSQFVYVRQPILTVSVSDATREYGPTGLSFTRTVAGLVNGDTATQAFTGTSAVADTTLATTGAGTYAGAAQVTLGTLASTIGYAFAFANAPVTITPAPLTIRANDATKVFGTTLTFAGTEFTAAGLRNADQVTGATLASAGAPADAPVAGSPYAITASNAQGNGLANYAVTYQPGVLTVSAAPVGPVSVSPLTIALTTPSLDRQFPVTFVPVSDPPDTIVAGGTTQTDLGSPLGVVGPGSGITSSGGPTLGNARGVDVAAAETGGDATLDDLEAVGRDLDASVGACEQRDSRRVKIYNDCVARALETYADKLDARIAQLPPALRNIPAAVRIPAVLARGRAGTAPLRSVPDVIRAAARQVRASRTVAQARTVVRAAVTVIRKAISLIRADEPVVAARQARHGNAIASAMESCDARLSRAIGL